MDVVMFLSNLTTGEVAAYVTALLAIISGLFAIIASFVTWRIDRKRLTNLELEKEKMRIDFEKHRAENIETFKEIRESIHGHNQVVIDKVDELKMYLINSKITLKGENEQTT